MLACWRCKSSLSLDLLGLLGRHCSFGTHQIASLPCRGRWWAWSRTIGSWCLLPKTAQQRSYAGTMKHHISLSHLSASCSTEWSLASSLQLRFGCFSWLESFIWNSKEACPSSRRPRVFDLWPYFKRTCLMSEQMCSRCGWLKKHWNSVQDVLWHSHWTHAG